MNYSSKEEKLVQKKFLEKGYFIFNIKDKKNLIRIKKTIVKLSEEWFKKKYKKKNNFSNLNYTHTKIPVKYLNSYRLFIYEKINSYKWFSEAYFSLGKKYIEMLSAGGTKSHNELLKPFGLSAYDKSFWDKGVSMISGLMDELESI